MEHPGRMNLAVDFGGGRHADLESSQSDQLWVAVGPGFTATDVWLKAGEDMIDLRVGLRRTDHGVDIVVDRGGGQEAWWGNEAAPHLAIVVSVAEGTATAVASAGKDRDFQEVLLGRMTI